MADFDRITESLRRYAPGIDMEVFENTQTMVNRVRVSYQAARSAVITQETLMRGNDALVEGVGALVDQIRDQAFADLGLQHRLEAARAEERALGEEREVALLEHLLAWGAGLASPEATLRERIAHLITERRDAAHRLHQHTGKLT